MWPFAGSILGQPQVAGAGEHETFFNINFTIENSLDDFLYTIRFVKMTRSFVVAGYVRKEKRNSEVKF